jgi:hypothetical protein
MEEVCKMVVSVTWDPDYNVIGYSAPAQYCGEELVAILASPDFPDGRLITGYREVGHEGDKPMPVV